MTKQNFKVPVVEYGTTLQEIPNEISLYFNLGKCACHCKGCHSMHLWDTNMITPMKNVDEVLDIVRKYQDDVTAVVFMGGNRNGMDFEEFAERILKPVSLVKPVGIYMGAWTAEEVFIAAQYCRWIKVGTFLKELGGLESPCTNQIFLEVQNYKFRKEETK